MNGSWYCWVCDTENADRDAWCCDCTAPRWDGSVASYPVAGPGVYVLESDSGLVKIGVSRSDVATRVKGIVREAACAGCTVTLIATLPGATIEHERWLHHALGDTRDPLAARDHCLPYRSEWFWPTAALRALVAGDTFARELQPWEIAA